MDCRLLAIRGGWGAGAGGIPERRVPGPPFGAPAQPCAPRARAASGRRAPRAPPSPSKSRCPACRRPAASRGSSRRRGTKHVAPAGASRDALSRDGPRCARLLRAPGRLAAAVATMRAPLLGPCVPCRMVLTPDDQRKLLLEISENYCSKDLPPPSAPSTPRTYAEIAGWRIGAAAGGSPRKHPAAGGFDRKSERFQGVKGEDWARARRRSTSSCRSARRWTARCCAKPPLQRCAPLFRALQNPGARAPAMGRAKSLGLGLGAEHAGEVLDRPQLVGGVPGQVEPQPVQLGMEVRMRVAVVDLPSDVDLAVDLQGITTIVAICDRSSHRLVSTSPASIALTTLCSAKSTSCSFCWGPDRGEPRIGPHIVGDRLAGAAGARSPRPGCAPPTCGCHARRRGRPRLPPRRSRFRRPAMFAMPDAL